MEIYVARSADQEHVLLRSVPLKQFYTPITDIIMNLMWVFIMPAQ